MRKMTKVENRGDKTMMYMAPSSADKLTLEEQVFIFGLGEDPTVEVPESMPPRLAHTHTSFFQLRLVMLNC